MANDEKNVPPKQTKKELQKPEVEPLSDEALEVVAGGGDTSDDMCCSCSSCSAGDVTPV